jgi:hypothetical protein
MRSGELFAGVLTSNGWLHFVKLALRTWSQVAGGASSHVSVVSVCLLRVRQWDATLARLLSGQSSNFTAHTLGTLLLPFPTRTTKNDIRLRQLSLESSRKRSFTDC